MPFSEFRNESICDNCERLWNALWRSICGDVIETVRVMLRWNVNRIINSFSSEPTIYLKYKHRNWEINLLLLRLSLSLMVTPNPQCHVKLWLKHKPNSPSWIFFSLSSRSLSKCMYVSIKEKWHSILASGFVLVAYFSFYHRTFFTAAAAECILREKRMKGEEENK